MRVQNDELLEGRSPWRSRALLPLGVLILGWSACSCGDPATELRRAILRIDLEADPEATADHLLDFGQVVVGDTKVLQVRLENIGSTELAVEPGPAEDPYAIDGILGPIRIAPGGSRNLTLSFLPSQVSLGPVEQILTLQTNESASVAGHRIRLSGQGISSSLDCDPASLDFGRSGLGATRALQVRCTNALPVALRLEELAVQGMGRASYSAASSLPEEGSLLLDPGEVLEVEVEFRASSLGLHDAALRFGGSGGTLLGTLPLRGEVVDSQIEVTPPGCLDFGFVPLGEQVRRTLELRNRGAEAAQLAELRLPPGSEGAFSIATPTPLALGAEPVEVNIDFHPQSEGLQTASIELRVEGAGGGLVLSSCARGFGGGPRLVCEEGPVDFGMVAVGVPRTLRSRCINMGSGVEGAAVALIESLTVNNPVFRSRVLNFDESIGEKVEGYGPGDGFWIESTFDPEAEGFASGLLHLRSASLPGGVVEIPLAGEGRVLEPCEIEVSPPLLYVGTAPAGQVVSRQFEIRNMLETACLIRDLQLGEGSHPAFSIAERDGIELEGFGTLVVEVRFSPDEEAMGHLEGKVVFEISHPLDRMQEVELRGVAAEPCLVFSPPLQDFGSVEPGCRSAQRPVSIRNQCPWPVELASIEIGEGGAASSEFELIRRPVLPRVLQSYDWVEVELRFSPSEPGSKEEQVEFTIHHPGHGYVQDRAWLELRGEGREGLVVTDEFHQETHPQVDVLFVIDNGFFMFEHLPKLRIQLPEFLTNALKEDVDFHLGVTTAGLDGTFRTWNCFGMEDGDEEGRLYPIDGSHPRILKRDTPNLMEHWQHNINLGSCNNGIAYQPMLEAALQALSPPLINSAKDPRRNSGFQDGNLGFLRPEAALSIVLITALSEGSEGSVPSYLDAFYRLKGPRSSSFLKIHAIAPPGRAGEYCGALPCDRLAHGVQATDGVFIPLRGQWVDGLKQMSQRALGFQSRFRLRNDPADQNGDGLVDERDVVVLVNGIERAAEDAAGGRVWSLNLSTEAIDFDPVHRPSAGSTISVTYTVSCRG